MTNKELLKYALIGAIHSKDTLYTYESEVAGDEMKSQLDSIESDMHLIIDKLEELKSHEECVVNIL